MPLICNIHIPPKRPALPRYARKPNLYRDQFKEAGMVFSGLSPDERLVEAVELPEKTFFVGVQYHPEFKSRPNHAHPLFRELIKAALSKKELMED